MDWSIVLQIVAGAAISIGFVILVEHLKKPILTMEIENPIDISYQPGRPARNVRYLGLRVRNTGLPKLARWLSRNAAIHCQGIITFHHLDGQEVFGRVMKTRWAGTQEPVPIIITVQGQSPVALFDPARLAPELHMDVHADSAEKIDVAARFDSDMECYGWSNDNYSSSPPWRDPAWKLEKGRYLVKVRLIYSSGVSNGLFRLVNDVPKTDFRLEKALQEDYKKLNFGK